MRMRSVTQHAFSMVPRAEIPRSSFDRSHGYKTTFDAGLLIPIFLDEALPGDTFNLSMTGFARLATPIFPIMDNMFMDTFFFAVPYRLVWDNWEKFNGAQDNPGDSTDFIIPVMDSNTDHTGDLGSLWDYFGLPLVDDTTVPGPGPGLGVSALPFRAYCLIWNEWFRDQNLQDSIPIPKDDGPDDFADGDYIVRRRGKRHDYFTSCLPFPQKGDAVALPLGTFAQVVSDTADGGVGQPNFTGANVTNQKMFIATGSSEVHLNAATGDDVADLAWGNEPALVADLSTATAATINQLRQAFQVQRLLERDARGGTRYTEIVRSHFGVVSPDARLQRPEYLGGGSSPVNVVAVPQTSATEAGVSPQGNLAAFGTATLRGHGFVKSFTEHCIVIGLVSVRADLTYHQGLDRMWTRSTRFDFYWPALSHIGEQAVLRKEIFCEDGGQAEDPNDLVWGYQERYGEYRYKPSRITGLFRTDAPASLSAWHLSQELTDTVALNDVFIEDNPPIDRVVAIPGEPHFLFDSFFKFRCARPMPMFGVPGMIDHF